MYEAWIEAILGLLTVRSSYPTGWMHKSYMRPFVKSETRT